MPIAIGDPGVFVCSIPDGGAEPERVEPIPAAAPRAGVWLVLATCSHCNPRTGAYCSDHGPGNWWLTTMASARPRKGNTPRSTA